MPIEILVWQAWREGDRSRGYSCQKEAPRGEICEKCVQFHKTMNNKCPGTKAGFLLSKLTCQFYIEQIVMSFIMISKKSF